MPPPSRGRWKAGALAPSAKPDLPAAGAPLVCTVGLLAAGLAASILTAAVLDRAAAFGPVDFNAFEGAFCDALRIAAAFFVVFFVALLADSLALAGRVFGRVAFSPISPIACGPVCERPALRAPWGISCAFSWTYAFLSSLSADQSWGVAGLVPAGRNQAGCWASLMASEYGYKEFDAPPVRSLTALLGPDDE